MRFACVEKQSLQYTLGVPILEDDAHSIQKGLPVAFHGTREVFHLKTVSIITDCSFR